MTLKTPTFPKGSLAGQASGQIPMHTPSATDGSMAVATIDNSQLPSPSPTITQPPVAWEAPMESSPDLGKFPAMRRRRGAGRRSRLPRQSQTGPVPQSDHSVSSDPTSQAVAYEPRSQALVNGLSHGAEPALQAGQQQELPNSSNTGPPTSNLPPATQDDKQISGTLSGVHPPPPR